MRSLPTATAVVFVSLLDTAMAADPAEIQKQAERIGQLKGMLTDNDPSVRVAAFQSMADSEDRAMRKLAIDAGIASYDPTLQGLALRYTIGDMNNIVVEFSPEELKKEDYKEFVKKYGNRYAINVQKFDAASGKFNGTSVLAAGGSYNLTGQIAGTSLQFVSYQCSANFHFDTEKRAEFKGAMSCETFPAIQGSFRVR